MNNFVKMPSFAIASSCLSLFKAKRCCLLTFTCVLSFIFLLMSKRVSAFEIIYDNGIRLNCVGVNRIDCQSTWLSVLYENKKLVQKIEMILGNSREQNYPNCYWFAFELAGVHAEETPRYYVYDEVFDKLNHQFDEVFESYREGDIAVVFVKEHRVYKEFIDGRVKRYIDEKTIPYHIAVMVSKNMVVQKDTFSNGNHYSVIHLDQFKNHYIDLSNKKNNLNHFITQVEIKFYRSKK